uniref:Uncharacterized protein n=1 Tax=Triticum urartu TaxID=4572 RepID=A0A8R7VCD7_TRIUA
HILNNRKSLNCSVHYLLIMINVGNKAHCKMHSC